MSFFVKQNQQTLIRVDKEFIVTRGYVTKLNKEGKASKNLPDNLGELALAQLGDEWIDLRPEVSDKVRTKVDDVRDFDMAVPLQDGTSANAKEMTMKQVSQRWQKKLNLFNAYIAGWSLEKPPNDRNYGEMATGVTWLLTMIALEIHRLQFIASDDPLSK